MSAYMRLYLYMSKSMSCLLCIRLAFIFMYMSMPSCLCLFVLSCRQEGRCIEDDVFGNDMAAEILLSISDGQVTFGLCWLAPVIIPGCPR